MSENTSVTRADLARQLLLIQKDFTLAQDIPDETLRESQSAHLVEQYDRTLGRYLSLGGGSTHMLQ